MVTQSGAATAGSTPAHSEDAVLFLEELARIQTGDTRFVPPIPESFVSGDRKMSWVSSQFHHWAARTLCFHLERTECDDCPPDPLAEDWWNIASTQLRERFPEADQYALDWACDIVGRNNEMVRISGTYLSPMPPADVTDDWLWLWVFRRSLPETSERLEGEVLGMFGDIVAGTPPWQGQTGPAAGRVYGLYHVLAQHYLRRFVLRNDHELERSERLVRAALACSGTTDQNATSIRDWIFAYVAPRLWRDEYYSLDDVHHLVECYPWLAFRFQQLAGSPALNAKLRSVISSFLVKADREGQLQQSARRALTYFTRYAGFDDFAFAVRWLDRPGVQQDSGWAIHLLRHIQPPTPDDVVRLRELDSIKAELLYVAAACAPAWGFALEQSNRAPDLPGIAGFGRWTSPYLGPSPWALNYGGNREVEWDLGAFAGERAGLRDAVEKIGPAWIRQLLKHPFIRQDARVARFCLSADLGENAAEVEAKFLKRDKWAVVALGMLPDEGDVADRYLALRRFAQEAKKSGPQRGFSEALAVQIALAHLAVTGGYQDVEALEWAIESQLAGGVDPTAKRWTTGDYTFWIEPDERATIQVEKGGKLLKSVPAAVRRTPDYAEAKEAREVLLAQAERVRRRLERALVSGEVLDRAAYDQLLVLPAGRALLPRLVLRVRLTGVDAPVDVLDGRTIAGDSVALDGDVCAQIAHPLQLRAAGTLDEWHRRLVQTGVVQPFNQLFRALYEPTADERTSQLCRRFQGRSVQLGAVRRALQRAGWETPGYYTGFVRRSAPPAVAELTLEDYVTFGATNEAVTLGELGFHGREWRDRLPALDLLWFSETLREVDLAASASLVDRAGGPTVSPERLAVRSALVSAFVPGATVAGEIATLPGGKIHLGTGAVFDPTGAALTLPELASLPTFPYREPEAALEELVARALFLGLG